MGRVFFQQADSFCNFRKTILKALQSTFNGLVWGQQQNILQPNMLKFFVKQSPEIVLNILIYSYVYSNVIGEHWISPRKKILMLRKIIIQLKSWILAYSSEIEAWSQPFMKQKLKLWCWPYFVPIMNMTAQF